MEHISVSSNRTSSLNKKNLKFAKNKFTDMKIKITKKKDNENQISERTSTLNEEKTKKLNLDNAKNIIDKELSNDKLMIKIIDNNTIYNYLDDFFYRSGEFDIQKDDVIEENYHDTVRNISETSTEFFKKFRKFNDHTRKGLLKSMNPSYGFIKAAQDIMIVPNPIGLIGKNGDQTTINLKDQNIGDDYIKCLSKGLEYANTINRLELSQNRLTALGVNPLIKSIECNTYLKKGIKVFDLSFNKIGDSGISKIITYINSSDCNLEELNLEGNSLGDDNVNKLCEAINNSLSHKISSLNISRNLISDESCINIANLLQRCSQLKILMISWNHIRNFGASLIINKLKKNLEMKVFDISWNSIGTNLNNEPQLEDLTKGAKPERNFMNFELNEFRTTMSLNFRKELMPPKDDKKKDGGKKENLKKETNTNPFPNIVTHKSITPFAKELAEYFKEINTELVHLDISHNNINAEDANYLSQECKYNHKILGIHVDGNEMSIDELGFIFPMKKTGKVPNYYANSQIYYNISRDQNLVKSNNEKIRKIRAKNNCWICEGWKEITFTYRPQKMKDPDKQFVKIHLSFENWKPYDTGYFDRTFKVVRMCPPGEVLYFFTVNKKPFEDYGEHNFILREPIVYAFDDFFLKEFNENEVKNNYLIKQTDGNLDGFDVNKLNQDNEELDMQELNKSNISYHSNITQIMGDDIKEENIDFLCGDKIRVKNLGRIQVDVNFHVVNDQYQKQLKYCEARPERQLEKFVKPRTPWSFPLSIWATYYDLVWAGEREELINDAFEHDFERCQMNVFIKNEEATAQVKEILKKYYKKILDCYKNLAALLGSSIWQISENTLKDFFTSCDGLVDLKVYNINGVLLQARGVKASSIDMTERVKNKNKNIPDNIIRHQFMSLLVRVARDKYITQLNMFNNIVDALNHSFENHYLSQMQEFLIQSWRQERYYNEFVDNYLKAHLPFMDALYKSWAPRKDPGKRDTWMILEEFTNLMNLFIESDFPVREIPILFIFSMRLQVSEITSDRHYNMLFPEFLEAFCRVIDKSCPIPMNEKVEDWPLSRRHEQSLFQKLQNITHLIMKNITNAEYKIIKEKVPLPLIEKETGLFSWDSSSSFYTSLSPNFRNTYRK